MTGARTDPRAIALRRRADGYTYANIAKLLGVSAATVQRWTGTPEAQDEMYGLLDGRWVQRGHVRVWEPA